MKRRILLTFVIAIVSVFSLALIAGADVIYKDTEDNELFRYELIDSIITNESGVGFAKTDADGNALIWYITENTTDESGNTVYTVTSKKTSEAVTITDNALNINTNVVRRQDIVSINFDVGNFTKIADNIFSDSKHGECKVIYAYIPSYVTTFGERVFRGCDSLIAIDIPYDSELTDMGLYPVYSTTNLRSLFIPKNVSFLNDGKNSADGTNNRDTTGYFLYCKSLKKVEFHPDNVITEMKNAPFFGASYIEEIRFSNNLKFLGDRTFRECNKLKTIYFGDSFEGFYSNYMFYRCSSLEALYFPATTGTNTTTMTHNWSQVFYDQCSSTFKIYFTGTEEQFINVYNLLIDAGNNPCIADTVQDGVINKERVFFITDCEAFYYGEHDIDENAEPDCVNSVACSRCSLVEKEALGHEFDTENGATLTNIIYESFGKDGYKEITCARCDEKDKSTVADAIFIAKGYSANPDNTGFATGFEINSSSLLAYENFYKTKINFGIMVFNPYYLNSDTFFVDGVIACEKGAIQVDMNTSYSSCSLSVNGFTAGLSDLELVFAGYAYDESSPDNVHFIQKEYISTEQTPVSSPMQSKVTKNDCVLYTVKLEAIVSHSTTASKESLDEYVKPSVA